MTITVSTDGSALANPHGPMGWAWADHGTPSGDEHAHTGDHDAGGATNGTNQIGELCAVLEVLRAHPGDEPLVIETDSQYAINCSTTWVRGWKRKGWRNSQGKPVKNAPLIKAIDAAIAHRPGPVSFRWVKGHAGNAGNEKVDDLAHTYAGDCRDGVRDGYLPREGWQSLMASDYARGLDVPSDARLLLDGAITDREYHLGRGEGPAEDAVASVAERRSGRPPMSADEPESTGAGTAVAAPADGTPGPTRPSGDARSSASAGDAAGLTVSGTLRFSPPPSSSPSFDGRPRRISGMLHVEGIVAPDGTLTLKAAPFDIS